MTRTARRLAEIERRLCEAQHAVPRSRALIERLRELRQDTIEVMVGAARLATIDAMIEAAIEEGDEV